MALQFVSNKSIELLSGVVFDEFNCVSKELLSSYNFVIKDLLSRLTLIESPSKSGFSLNSLHNFLVLYLRIMDKFAISISISSSSRLARYTFFLSYLGEIGPSFD